jgi:hypothetical protein
MEQASCRILPHCIQKIPVNLARGFDTLRSRMNREAPSTAPIKKHPDSWLLVIFALQIAALAIAGWIYRESLNSDAIAYLRLAHYYAEGPIELAVSGNWGPMLSWALAPLLKIGIPQLAAARIAMAISSVWFLWASIALFRSYGLPIRTIRWLSAITALLTIPWSVENITPDLLVGGFICAGVAAMSDRCWMTSPGRACLAGVIWGAAYLAKAIALPLALLTATAFALLWWFSLRPLRAAIVRPLGITLLAFGLTAAPWMTILSMKYHRFTFSTTRAMMHAVGNPITLQATNTPFLGNHFRTPEPGRITVWEDPVVSSEFEWSPVSSWDNARRQWLLVSRSFVKTQATLTSIFPAWLPVIFVAGWILLRTRPRTGLLRQQFGWPLVPALILNSLYLPQEFMITEHRYFFGIVPLLLIALLQVGRVWQGLRSRVLIGTAVAITVLFAWGRLAALGSPSRTASHYAGVLSAKLQNAGITDAPYAGNAFLPRGRTGLCLAFLMNKPWIGDVQEPTAEIYRRSGARIFVLRRDAPLISELKACGDFESLDPLLFADPAEANAFPATVYRLRK